jgi:alkylation response protein AidB-like acyl-CoA dehydrogenase
MALGVSEEHLELAASVRGWAERHSDPDVLADSYPGVLRAGLAGQGLLGLHLPEEHGGQGYGLSEQAVALEELGRALVPGGFLPTVLASALLARAGNPTGNADTGKLLAGLADGSRTGAVSLATGLTGTISDGVLTLDGASAPVLGGGLADLLVLPVRTGIPVRAGDPVPAPESKPTGADELWAVIDAADLVVTGLDSLDQTRPLVTVSASGVRVPAGRILAGLTRTQVTSLTAALFAAEASGIADWAVQTAADYARIRHQFGRPIGQFQAVKHRCARMLTAAEQAAAASWDAVAACEARDDAGSGTPAPREFAAAVAAVVALDAAVSCTHECIQVLGGIGYTWEHPAHRYYRRALSLRALLGPSAQWARRVAELALDGARRPVRVDLPADAGPLRTGIRAELAAVAALDPPARTAGLAAGGWVVPHLPAPWGRAASPLEQLVIAEEMKQAGLRAPALLIGAWVVPALVGYGTPAQQERFLPATLRGEITWCQLFSEPGAGSDLAGLSTRAERVTGDGEGSAAWRLTGQKVWTSLAREADWAICVARTDPSTRRHAGITYFLVDMKSPGVSVHPLREMTGDALFNEVFLDGVEVPDDLVVGEAGDGWRVARTTLANERVSLSRTWTFGCGTPELLDVLSGLGEPARQAWFEQAGQLVAEGHALDVLGMRVTLKQLSGTEPGATGSVRKLLGMRHAQQVAELCWSMQGPAGALGFAAGGTGSRPPAGSPSAGSPAAGSHWARQVLLTRALTIGGGTTDIQLNIIGERMLGLPRDPEPPAG